MLKSVNEITVGTEQYMDAARQVYEILLVKYDEKPWKFDIQLHASAVAYNMVTKHEGKEMFFETQRGLKECHWIYVINRDDIHTLIDIGETEKLIAFLQEIL